MTTEKIIIDLEARIATNRAQFDLLQILWDKYVVSGAPEARYVEVPTPDGLGRLVSIDAKKSATPKQNETKRRGVAPRGIALAFRKWIAAQPAEFEIGAARAALGGTQSAISCAALKLLRGGQLERVRNGWYRRTAKFEAPAETVADRYARESETLRTRLNTEMRTTNAA